MLRDHKLQIASPTPTSSWSNRLANNHAGTPGRAYEKPTFPGWPQIPVGVEPTDYKGPRFDDYPWEDDDPTWFKVQREAPSIGADTRVQLPILKHISPASPTSSSTSTTRTGWWAASVRS